MKKKIFIFASKKSKILGEDKLKNIMLILIFLRFSKLIEYYMQQFQ